MKLLAEDPTALVGAVAQMQELAVGILEAAAEERQGLAEVILVGQGLMLVEVDLLGVEA